jgi:hypothetical protein
MGNGPTLYRAEDHQCFKDVLVVKGKENPTSEFDLLEMVEVTPVEQVTYAPDHPQFAAAIWAPATRAHNRQVFGIAPGPHPNGAGLPNCPTCRIAAPTGLVFSRGMGHGRDLLQVLNGLDKGSAYALIALGLTLIFGTLGVVNFAHGALFMIGAFCAVTLSRL